MENAVIRVKPARGNASSWASEVRMPSSGHGGPPRASGRKARARARAEHKGAGVSWQPPVGGPLRSAWTGSPARARLTRARRAWSCPFARRAVKVSHGRSSSITMCPRQGGRGGLETALPERWRGSAACKPTDRTLASRSQPQETGVSPTTAWPHGPLGAAADPAPSTGWAARQRQAAGGLGTARAAASPAGGRVHTRRPGAVTTQPSLQTCE